MPVELLRHFLPTAKEAIKIVDGVKHLNLQSFRKTITSPALYVPKSLCQEVRSLEYDSLACINNVCVVKGRKDEGKVHLLCPPATTCSSFTKKVQNLLSTREISLETLDSEVTVADFGFEMVCNLVLPEECRNVRHFDIIGHVAQIGLTFHFDSKDYAKVAAQAILATKRDIRTVVRKVAAVSGVERLQQYEVVAGEADLVVDFNYLNCRYKCDLSKVFWNHKIGSERTRVVSLLKRGDDVLCDMFAGIGPYSIMAAKKRCRVYANDVNKHCAGAISESAKANRLANRISVFNLDVREFLPGLMGKISAWDRHGPESTNSCETWPMFTHVVMNLPRTAIQFLDVFSGLLVNAPHLPLPLVHVYFMCKMLERDLAVQEACDVLSVGNLGPEMDIHKMNTYSTTGSRYCLSFRLPEKVAFASLATTPTDES